LREEKISRGGAENAKGAEKRFEGRGREEVHAETLRAQRARRRGLGEEVHAACSVVR
jgi:hypothetical protein